MTQIVINFLNMQYSLMFVKFVWSFVLLQIADNLDNFQKENWNIMYFTNHYTSLSSFKWIKVTAIVTKKRPSKK